MNIHISDSSAILDFTIVITDDCYSVMVLCSFLAFLHLLVVPVGATLKSLLQLNTLPLVVPIQGVAFHVESPPNTSAGDIESDSPPQLFISKQLLHKCSLLLPPGDAG